MKVGLKASDIKGWLSLDKKTLGIVGFISLIAYLLYFHLKGDSLVQKIVTSDNHFLSLILVIIVNPTLVLLILTLFNYLKDGTRIKEFIASVLLVLAFEIVSLPWLPKTGMPTELSAKVSLDFLFANLMIDAGMAYGLFYKTTASQELEFYSNEIKKKCNVLTVK